MSSSLKQRCVVWIVPRLIKFIYRFLVHSIRWQMIGNVRHEEPERYLYAFWHARMLMIPKLARGDFHGYMLISEHRDGGFIADTMHLLGIDTVRGSSTRGGAKAMLKMVRAVKEEGRHLAITPDGPKGPRETMKPGTVQLAMKTGLPLVPVCYATSRQWRINSWDHFYIPKPFSRGVFVVGEPVAFEADASVESLLPRFQAAMDVAQQTADAYFD